MLEEGDAPDAKYIGPHGVELNAEHAHASFHVDAHGDTSPVVYDDEGRPQPMVAHRKKRD
jgi:hypothetical protein